MTKQSNKAFQQTGPATLKARVPLVDSLQRGMTRLLVVTPKWLSACSITGSWNDTVVRPSVCLSVCNVMHCDAQGWCKSWKLYRRVPI